MKRNIEISQKIEVFRRFEVTVYECGHKLKELTYESSLTKYHMKEGDREWDDHEYWYLKEDNINLIWDDSWNYPEYIYEDTYDEKYVDKECWVCSQMRKINPRVQNIPMAHGVSAFRAVHSLQEMLDRIQYMRDNPWIEISTSNTDFRKGPMGIITDSVPIAAFDSDVWSEHDEEGRRWITENTNTECKILSLRNKKRVKWYSHAEYFTNPDNIIAVWIKSWYWKQLSNEEKKTVSDFCKENRYCLQFCKGTNDDVPVPGYEEEWG